MWDANFAPLPQRCLVDEMLHIRACGFAPAEPVTLRLVSRGVGGAVLGSQATFVATHGDIDLTRDAPVAGNYDGVDGMGLFWSRAPLAADDPLTRLALPDDFTSVMLLAQDASGQVRFSHLLQRAFHDDQQVAVREVREQGLVGRFFAPRRAGPHPAVLVVGGSAGGLAGSREMAALLASHGYAALALAYFAMEGLPATLARIPLEYFGQALEWLQSQPDVDQERIAVSGTSRGGELALLLGATYPALRAVVAYVPSGIAWPAYPPTGHGAWTLGGKDIPYAQVLSLDAWKLAVAEGRARPDSFDWYFIPLQDAAYADAASIRVENIRGPVLMISGEDDAIWPSTELAEFAMRRLQAKGFAHPFSHLRYPGAGHSIAWPNTPTTMTKFTHPVSGAAQDLGGRPRESAHARRDSWARMLAFLRESLSEGMVRSEAAHPANRSP